MVRLIRYIAFCVFFAAGIGAITLALLIKPELTNYFQSVYLLDKTEKDNEKIQRLIEQYDAQNSLIEREPNVLSRLQQVTFGQTPPAEEGVVYPTDYNPQLAVLAKEILQEAPPTDPNEFVPTWAKRCTDTRYRWALFLSGAGLLLVTFTFFGTNRRKSTPKKKF